VCVYLAVEAFHCLRFSPDTCSTVCLHFCVLHTLEDSQ